MAGDAVRLVAADEARHRRPGLVGLTLLIALAAAVTLTAAAGARRTATALERFAAATERHDAVVVPADRAGAERLVAALAEEPWVDEVALVETFALGLADRDDGSVLFLQASPDAAHQSAVDRPVVVAGRLPLPGTTTEIAVNEAARRDLGLEPGDQVTVELFDPDAVDCLLDGTCAPGTLPTTTETLVVTGVTRTVDDLLATGGSPTASGPSSLFAAVDGRAADLGFPQVVVGLAAGPAGIDRLEAFVDDVGLGDARIGETSANLEAPQQAIDVQAVALLVFAVVTALAGATAVANAVGRHLSAQVERAEVLRALGMARRERARALALPTVAAGVVGAVLAAVGAGLASGAFPFGAVRAIEPRPGPAPDLVVLGAGGLAVALLVAAGTVTAAGRLTRPGRAGVPRRPSTVAEALNGAGAGPALVAGVRLALEPGAGRSRVPTRSALVGAVVGVTGLVAALVFGASQHDLRSTPARWGVAWDRFATPLDAGDLDGAVTAAAGTDGVADVGLYAVGRAEVGGLDQPLHALDPLDGAIDHTMLDGRPPRADDEVAVGALTAAALDLGVGDEVTVGDEDLTVVGVVVLPPVQAPEPGRGALVTPATWSRLDQDDGRPELVLRLEDGADPDAVADDLRAVGVGAREATVPPLLDHLDDDDVVLAGLVVYFALLATVGLVHALATSVRRRRGLFAVWRTLGLTPAQVRRAVLTQATVVVGGGLLVGVPLGLAAGRVTWALVIGDLGVLDSPTTPGPALMLTAAAAVVTGLAVATPPARRAARRRPGPDLREP